MSSKRFKLLLRPDDFTTPGRRPFSIRRVWGTPLPKIPRTECKTASPAKVPSEANRQKQSTNVSVAEITKVFVASYGHSDLPKASRSGVLFGYNYIDPGSNFTKDRVDRQSWDIHEKCIDRMLKANGMSTGWVWG